MGHCATVADVLEQLDGVKGRRNRAGQDRGTGSSAFLETPRTTPSILGLGGATYRLEKAQVVPEGSQHPDEGDNEHDYPQKDEDDGRGQEGALQGFVFLPLDLCIDPH